MVEDAKQEPWHFFCLQTPPVTTKAVATSSIPIHVLDFLLLKIPEARRKEVRQEYSFPANLHAQ
jgi:hypothetical protein